jgi:hypothetical protein
VAEYVKAYDREHGTTWEQTLQERRYELDEMVTTAALLDWLDGLLAGTSKVMPPPEVLEEEHLQNEIARVTKEIEEAAFRAYGRDEKVAAATEALRADEACRAKNRALLPERLELGYKRDPARSWRSVLQGLLYRLRRLPGH